MIQVSYTCMECGLDQTHEHSELRDVADIAPVYEGMDDCPESKYDDAVHQYGLVKVEKDGEEVPMYDVIWLRESEV